jgi:uncharacterized cupin superfamily protein
MRCVHHPALPEQETRSPTGKFHSFFRNISLALGGIANTGTWAGGHPFDVQLRRIPPGAAVCPYHLHLAQWELFIVHRGVGSVRTPDGTFAVKTGEVFYHPPGVPHQLTNSGRDDLEVFIVTDHAPLDSCYYPDSDKRSLRPPGKVFRLEEVHYFDGEDTLPSNPPPFVVSPAPLSAPIVPFAQRRVHPDDLPWDEWQSPKGKFRGRSKELSIALGAKRNTPTGLGGHPFDLELGKLAPGERPCPFHSHATQWELFIFLAGTAKVRANDETAILHAGDIVVHPPGEAHDFTNTGDTDLLYYCLADNPPVDYWHYPDSGKWGLRSPREFFRIDSVEYYDGEE